MKKLFLVLVFLAAKTMMAQIAVTNTGTLYISGADTFFAGNDFTNNSGSALTNNGQLYVQGNLSNDQVSMAAGTGTLYLNGSTAQSINGTVLFKTFNFVSNNSAGIILNNDLYISGAHTFTTGIITTSATPNYLVYEAGSSYTGDADARHVNGWVKKFGSTNFIFPVGNGTVERTIAMNSLSLSSEINTKYYSTAPPNQYATVIPLRSVDAFEYWAVNKVSGGTATLTLNWDKSKIYFPNYILADLAVASYNGSAWVDFGGTASGNVNTTGTITSNTISSFNLFTFGSRSWVLPLTLISFTAKRQDHYTQINWSTANEHNVNHFIIERSDDGRSFYSIGQVAARNSGNSENYNAKDNLPIHQIAYYRLRSVDNDGKEILSQTVTVTEGNAATLTLLTNPVHSEIKLLATSQLDGIFRYQLRSANGQAVQQGTLTIQSGGGKYEIPLTGKLSPGTYTLIVTNQKQSFYYKLILF